MKKRTKGILKIAGISFGSLIAVVLIVIVIVTNFVFTPARLTPVVLKTANQALNAKLDMKSVELTFFSTFPRFGLKLVDGHLVSKVLNDTAWQKTDSLLSFGKCVVVINPLDYLMERKVTLNYLGLEDASVYAFKNKDGIANWDIVASDTAEVEADTASADKQMLSGGIDIRRVALKRANVIFDDRDTRVYARLTNASLNLTASLHKEHSTLGLRFANDNVLFWQDGQLLVNKVATELRTSLDLDRRTRTLTLKDANISINGITFDVKGTLKRDTVQRALCIDMAYGLHAPSLETVLNMIPESVLKREEMTAKGSVKMEGDVKGWYGKEQMPAVTLKVKIDKASAKYDKLPYGIDDFTADFHAFVDLMRRQPSYADLKIFHFQGAHTDILADAKVTDLLGDPDITFNTKSKADLTALAKTFPLQDGVTIGGNLDADLHLKCRLSSIKKQDLGRIRMAGKLELKNLSLRDTNRDFEFTSDASLKFMGNDNLAAQAEINKLVLRSKLGNSNVEKLTMTVKSTNPQDTTRIADMECKFLLNRLKGNMGDSLALFCQKADATVRLQPGKKNPSMPQVALSLKADTMFCRAGQTKMGMDKAGFAVTAEKLRDSLWIPKGIIGFNRMKMSTPEFALPIRMKKTSVTVGNRMITLKNATCRVGHSDLTATGVVYDLYGTMKRHRPLRAKLEISSRNLDCNQIINSLNFPEDTLQAEADTTSASLELFVIPKNLDFELQTNLKRVKYDNMVFEDVHGAVDIRNQAVHLKDLSMRGMDAQMNATLVYRAREKKSGYAGFDFKLHKINIAKLVEFVPSLDTIVPMLRSFQGVVDFDAAAEAVLDSNLNIKIPSLRSAVHIKGDSLVLMDGETFAEISKMLMFKNKKRNMFDSISVNMTVKDGNVTVYPFIVQIDRYKAAVGGTQGLDMNFSYHISILKSPLPFKMGVNITGNLDKMKFKLGKAKYKDAVTPVEIRKVDSTRINMGQQIVNDFHRVMSRKPESE
ncbi:AsmA-like C-terminal region-containing protein [Phocaeicola sp.]|uniref:AsmA-like C-terminal region-containing protein n=1 Tax=Phocaeicola sp. TaxID=2773926 RepID=UPI003AB6D10A